MHTYKMTFYLFVCCYVERCIREEKKGFVKRERGCSMYC
jgi:hypothetical protein